MTRDKNNLDRLFTDNSNNCAKLICYFPLGDPAFNTLRLADTYLSSGVDVLEMGIAVPNPYMDGAIVSASMKRTRSLRTTEECLDLVYKIREAHPEAALEVFCYKQLLDTYAVESLAAAMEHARIDSILIADNTLEETIALRKALPDFVSILGFLPYEATREQMHAIANTCDGYAFLQATNGLTGARAQLEPKLPEKIRSAKGIFGSTAICPGFGISTPEHCAQVRAMGADGLIIGSETLRRALMGECELTSFLAECKRALR